MAAQFDGKKFGAYLAIPFTLTNATTGESNTDLQYGGIAANWVAPAAGSVVGISASCPAITAGSVTLRAHSAGAEFAQSGYPAPVLSSANDTNGTYASVGEGVITFAAGATLGISATTTTTLDPTDSLDVTATLFVVLNAD